MSLDPKELKDGHIVLVMQTTSNQNLVRVKNCPKAGTYPGKVSEILALKLQKLKYLSIGGSHVGSKKQRWAWKEGRA